MMDLTENYIQDPMSHWYYRHKFRFISRCFDPRFTEAVKIVDIGAGSALFTKELIKRGLVDNAIAVDTGYELDSISADGKIHFKRSDSYEGTDFFLMTDVLEHIEDDQAFLMSVVDQAPSGSKFVITVPALMCLWSGHDVFLKHFRRYNLHELKILVEKSGLKIDSARYLYSTVFLIAYLHRKIFGEKTSSQMKEAGWLSGKIIALLLFPDRWLTKVPFGVSLFLTAHKD
jgi:hypothetical protein